jgi:hypothetical protein
MKSVFILWHIREIEAPYPDSPNEDTKLIGVYSSPEAATAAIARLRDMPGFRDYPENFEFHEYLIDRDGWREGFTTIVSGEPLFKPAESGACGEVGDRHEVESAPKSYVIRRDVASFNPYAVCEVVENGLTTGFEVYLSRDRKACLLATVKTAEEARHLIEKDRDKRVAQSKR